MKNKTVSDVQSILSRIKFAPSCIDMGYRFEVKIDSEDGFKIRASFQRPDTRTGVMGTGFGRWHVTPADSSTTAIVKTAWVAVKMVVEHELMESMMYRGVRIFNPHKSLKDLAHPRQFDTLTDEVNCDV